MITATIKINCEPVEVEYEYYPSPRTYDSPCMDRVRIISWTSDAADELKEDYGEKLDGMIEDAMYEYVYENYYGN